MVQFNHGLREITLKVVYYGPALSGKTTNLQMLHQLLDPEARGRLMTLDTADDRTLFFDLLPVFFKTKNGFKVKIKLYTVPGQVMHTSTRRIVLAGADAVAFIADSRRAESRANTDAWRSMIENLKQNGIQREHIPICIQFNKRDLPDVRTDQELEDLKATSREPIIKAVAVRGEGVVETLRQLLSLTYRNLQALYELDKKFGMSEAEFLEAVFKRARGAGAPNADQGPQGQGEGPKNSGAQPDTDAQHTTRAQGGGTRS